MFARQTGVRAVQALALFGLVASIGGCAAKVKRVEFNNEMARLREEVAAGDRQVATRLDSRVDSVNQAANQTNQKVADHARRLDALDQEFKAFRSEFKVSIEKMQNMLKFNVPVHFDFARAEIRDSDRAVLDRFAAVVKEYYPGALITVEGFADPSGSAGYNQRLGKKRADTVKDYLATTGGVAADHLRAVSYGEARNRQAVAGAKGPGDPGLPNRRVALVVDHASIPTDGNVATQ